MPEERRKDKTHDVGDSMPGTVGDSKGTFHDRLGGQSFIPEEDVIDLEENQTQSDHEREKQEDSQSENVSGSQGEESTRMKYAKRYGDSWPEDRKRRFLREHDVSAREMDWKLTE